MFSERVKIHGLPSETGADAIFTILREAQAKRLSLAKE